MVGTSNLHRPPCRMAMTLVSGLGHQSLAHLFFGPADLAHGRLAGAACGDHETRHRCGGGRDEHRPGVNVEVAWGGIPCS